jgi:hypothetical protein
VADLDAVTVKLDGYIFAVAFCWMLCDTPSQKYVPEAIAYSLWVLKFTRPSWRFSLRLATPSRNAIFTQGFLGGAVFHCASLCVLRVQSVGSNFSCQFLSAVLFFS